MKRADIVRGMYVTTERGKFYVYYDRQAYEFFGGRFQTRVYKKDLPKEFEVENTYCEYDI